MSNYSVSVQRFSRTIAAVPVQAELRYEAWTEVAGVKFPTKRSNYHNGLKLGAITDAVIQVSMGLTPKSLAMKPPNFPPEIPQK